MDTPFVLNTDADGGYDPARQRWIVGIKPVVSPYPRAGCAQLGYVLAVPNDEGQCIHTIARQPHITSVN